MLLYQLLFYCTKTTSILEENHAILKTLQAEINKNKTWFIKAVKTILDENISNYPILVAFPSFTNLNIGLPISEGEKFSFNATTLEELAMKKIVSMEKVDEFRKVFREKKDSFCIFLLEKPAPQFIFMPY